jgi:hypothetical protein
VTSPREVLDKAVDETLRRISEFESQGMDFEHASRHAWLETRIQNWPAAWGNDLHILIYGDFEPLTQPLAIPSLGITVEPGHVDGTVIKTARTVQQGAVRVLEKSVAGLSDAARRINILLGVWTLQNFANGTIKWWSWVTHDAQSAVQPVLSTDVDGPANTILALPGPTRRRFNSALYWIREPHSLLHEFPRADRIRQFAAFWNAFECLVDAVNEVIPKLKLSPAAKKAEVDKFFSDLRHPPTPGDVQRCYREIVDPGFVGRANNALDVCFPEGAESWKHECFRRPDEHNQLYNVRNAINHGELEAEDPAEIARLDARLTKVQILVLQMFSRAATVAATGKPIDASSSNVSA